VLVGETVNITIEVEITKQPEAVAEAVPAADAVAA
jgi:hypothetical protein